MDGESPRKSFGLKFDIASIYKNIQQKLRDVKDGSDDPEVTPEPKSKLPNNDTVAASTSESETHSDSKVVTTSVPQPCLVSVVPGTETEVASGGIPAGPPCEVDEDTSIPASGPNSCSVDVSTAKNLPASNHTEGTEPINTSEEENNQDTETEVGIGSIPVGLPCEVNEDTSIAASWPSSCSADVSTAKNLPASHSTEDTEPTSSSEEDNIQDTVEEMDVTTNSNSGPNTSNTQHDTVFIKQEREDDYESFGDIVIKQEKEDLAYERAYGGDPDLFVVKRERRGSSCSEDSDVVFNGWSYRLPDDSDSDTSSLSSFDSVTSDLPPEMTDFQHIREPAPILRTYGEIFPEELPPLENLHISLPEETKLEELGVVTGIVGVLVVVESTADLTLYSPLNDDSVLFFENKQPLGVVFEVFGPCKSPSYSVRFNSPMDIEDKGIEIGLKVFFVPEPVPEVGEITHYVFVKKLKQVKGSDASWGHNNEPPLWSLDYSDDEEEKRALAKRKAHYKLYEADADSDTDKSKADDAEAKENHTFKRRRGAGRRTETSHQKTPFGSRRRQFNAGKKYPVNDGPGTPAGDTGFRAGRRIRPPPSGPQGPPPSCPHGPPPSGPHGPPPSGPHGPPLSGPHGPRPRDAQGPPRFPPRPGNPWIRPMSGHTGTGAAPDSPHGQPWSDHQNNSSFSHGPAPTFSQSQWNGPSQGGSVGSRPPFPASSNMQSQPEHGYPVNTSMPPPSGRSYHDFDRPASDAHIDGWPSSHHQSDQGYGSHNPGSALSESAQHFHSHIGAGPFRPPPANPPPPPPRPQPQPRFQGRPHFMDYHNGQHQPM